MANVKISELPIGIPNLTSIFPFVDSGTTYQGAISAITSIAMSVTYSELVNKITGGTLTSGSYYTITDFRTCYDQPDFTWNGNSITEGNYKQSDVEPIVVFATSANTISTTAYQPLYPNDRIQYDWTWNMTEVTSGASYGRITERIDEFNNRTDYDHRTIEFKRYRLFTYRQDQPLNGTIELFDDGLVEGNNTSFESLNVGDVIYVPSVQPSYYEITSIDDDVTMTVSGDTIVEGSNLVFYKTIEETNDTNGYFSYKRTNVKTTDFSGYTTFGNAIDGNYAKNNYVGNFANNYTNVSNGTFILANNVFLEGEYESNKFGDYCYNNTFGTDNQNNIWGDYCFQNVSTNDIDDNIIGHYFYDNLINVNLISNHIGNDFNNNQLLSENSEDFEDNIIGNGFNSNIIYSRFYKNEILDNFNDNVIGDSVSLTEFEFYRNYIRNNFNENTIRQDFQNNQIGTNFQENEINGEFQGNTILNGFNNNEIGYDFRLNNIGNGFNDNTVYDDFYNNTTDYYFNDNVISYQFYNNIIGLYFEDNQPPNSNLFGWNNLATVSTRTYDTFRVSLNNYVGNYILGKQLVMRVISTSQYFKIKFTKWTQGANGGGFQYERQEINSNGNNIGNSIIFTKTNGGSEVDIIVEGVVELTRDSQGGLYNTITDTPPFNNGWPGPSDTEWNSIYTQENNGRNFTYNKIGNDFQNNEIGSYFGYDDGDENENGNKIGDDFRDNTILSTMYGNIIGNNFDSNEITNDFYKNEIGYGFYNNEITGETYNNRIGEQFENNTIYGNFNDNQIFNEFKGNITYQSFSENRTDWGFGGNQISGNCYSNSFGPTIDSNDFLGNVYGNTFKGAVFSNTIGDNFAYNNIGFGFSSNVIGENFGYGASAPQGNNIGNYFQDNTIGEYFYNNSITDNFKDNEVGNYFQWNIFNTNVDNVDFTLNYGNITGFSYVATGTTATDDLYTGVEGNTDGSGFNAFFNIEVSGNEVIGVSASTIEIGQKYQVGDIITIPGTDIGGTSPDDDVVITVTGISENSLFYQHYTKQIFERRGGDKRVSYYDETDILNIDSIYLASGYIAIYSQSLSFPINYTSFEFECDGSYTNNGGNTNQTVNNMAEIVTLFNSQFRNFGYFFDNNDGTLGLYINPSLKEQYCPSGVYTINVFND